MKDNNINNMKDMIKSKQLMLINCFKQSVIGALYLFSTAAFLAVVVITIYALAGR